MADSWVVDADYPAGHLVPMTDDEQAQLEQDQAAAAVVTDANEAARRAVEQRMETLRRARAEIAYGDLFASLSAPEKVVLNALLLVATGDDS